MEAVGPQCPFGPSGSTDGGSNDARKRAGCFGASLVLGTAPFSECLLRYHFVSLLSWAALRAHSQSVAVLEGLKPTSRHLDALSPR